MSSTTFTDGVTVIRSSWLNDVNGTTYNGTFPNNAVTFNNLTWNGITVTPPSGGTTTFLRNDGTWQTPGGSGIGTVTSITFTSGQLTGGTITSTGTVGLATTSVTAGSYTSANITVDAYGRITAAANGSGGGSTPTLQQVATAGNTYTGGIVTSNTSTFQGVLIGASSSGPTGTAYGIETTTSVIGIGNSTSQVYLYGSSLVPQTSTTYGLGSSAYQWGSLYLSGTFNWNGYGITAPSGSTSTFLRNDGTWASVSSSTPNLQQVCNVYNITTTNASFAGTQIGATSSGPTGTVYGIANPSSSIIGFGNSTSNIYLYTTGGTTNLIPGSAAGGSSAVGLGSNSYPFQSITVCNSGTAAAFSSSPTTVYIESSTNALGAYLTASSSLSLTAYASLLANYSGNYHFSFFTGSPSSYTVAGTISSPTSTSVNYGTTSDRRLKTNIQNYANSGAIIDALQPRSFNWVGSGVADVGFIADEVQAVVAGAVVGQANAVDSNGKPVYQMVDLSAPEMMANIVAELKSIRARLHAANL